MASMPLGLNHQQQQLQLQPQAEINEPQKLAPRRTSEMDSDKVRLFLLLFSSFFFFFTILPFYFVLASSLYDAVSFTVSVCVCGWIVFDPPPYLCFCFNCERSATFSVFPYFVWGRREFSPAEFSDALWSDWFSPPPHFNYLYYFFWIIYFRNYLLFFFFFIPFVVWFF